MHSFQFWLLLLCAVFEKSASRSAISKHSFLYFLKFCKDYFMLSTKTHLATMNVIGYNLMFNAVVWLFVSLRHLKHFFRCREFMKSHVLFNLHLLRCYDNQCSNSQNDGILKKLNLKNCQYLQTISKIGTAISIMLYYVNLLMVLCLRNASCYR